VARRGVPEHLRGRAGVNNLANQTNALIASYFLTLKNAKGQKLEAQVLAVSRW
jgi:hypothetical protein